MARFTPPGHFRSVEAFEDYLHALDPELLCAHELTGADGPLGQPIQVYDRQVGNRFAAHPMEGWDGTLEGLPTEPTLRRWRNFGASGAKLIWGGEAYAVQFDGRANPNQLFLNPTVDSKVGLASLLAEINAGHASIGESTDDLLVGLQLTHSGRFARPDASGSQPKLPQHNPVLSKMYSVADTTPLLTDTELETIGENFVRTAALAQDVGFDFVDVKCCHGYLLHEMLSATARAGRYGGSFENRTRLFRRIVDGIRAECPGLHLGVRVSIHDIFPFVKDKESGIGVPGGMEDHVPYNLGFGIDPESPLDFDENEPYQFIELLRSLDIRLINITLGSPYWCPHLQRPATYPPSDGYQPPEDPLLSVARHLHAVRRCKETFPEMLFVGTGYSYLQEFIPHIAQAEVAASHVDFVGLGRLLLSYPEFPRDVLAGNPLQHKKLCRTFSDCTTAPRHHMISGCFPLDPYYKKMPQAIELRGIKQTLKSQGPERNDPEASRKATS